MRLHEQLPPGAAWLAVTTLYVALTAAYAWPLLGAIGTALPNDVGDPGLNTWILWWNARAVPLTEGWWNAPIFYPVPGAFALSETLLSLTLLTTPLFWAGVDAVRVYNVAFLVSYPATALAAHALAHRLTGRHDAALVAGLAFGFSPYRASQISHLQMLWAMWMPACLLALHRFLDTRRARYLVLAGVCWVLNGLTSGYFLVYFAVLVGLWVLWFARPRRDWVALGVTLGLASLVLVPLLVGYQQHQSAFGVSRSVQEIDFFSADLTGFWATADTVWAPRHWTFEPRAEGELYPGAAILLVTLAGAVAVWRRARTRRWNVIQMVVIAAGLLVGAAALTAPAEGWRLSILGLEISLTRVEKALFTSACLLLVGLLVDRRARDAWRRRSVLLFYAAAAVVMLVMALGPTGKVFGTTFLFQAPYSWLMELPGGDSLRVPARFAMLCALCLAQAAAVAFARLTPTGAPKLFLAGVATAVLIDGWVPDFPIDSVSPATTLTASAEREIPVLELPMRGTYGDTLAMVRATAHGHPLFNGFSGYEPPHYAPLQEAVGEWDPSVFEALRRLGPFLVMVDRSADPDDRLGVYVDGLPGEEESFRVGFGPVSRFSAVEEPAEPQGIERLPIAYVSANSNIGNVHRMLDADLTTAWNSGGPQTNGHEVVIAFPQAVMLSRLELDLGVSGLDYPRRLRVDDISDDAPATVWEGRTAGLAVLGAMFDFRRRPVAIGMPSLVAGERFRLTILEDHPTYYWTIAELRAFGRLD